jgi:hypothetical protein
LLELPNAGSRQSAANDGGIGGAQDMTRPNDGRHVAQFLMRGTNGLNISVTEMKAKARCK